MNVCLSICIPEEIWINIVGDSGPVLQQLFTLNKRLNMYFEKIKHKFIKNCIIHKYYEYHNIKNAKSIIVVKNDNKCIIKYDDIQHILNVKFCDNIDFMIDERLGILLVYSERNIKYCIYDKILYNMEKYIITNEKIKEKLNKKHKSIDVINKICNLTCCGWEIAEFALIYCNFDVRNSLMFISPGFRHIK